MATYLVTGAAGFIGRSIAAELLSRGHAVRGIDSLISGRRANLIGLEAMEFIEGDLADLDTCMRICKGVDVVFHEAALASVQQSIIDPIITNRNCVNATLNLLVAAARSGVRRIIYAGSSSAYGEASSSAASESMPTYPMSPYAVAKLAGEHYMRCFARTAEIETVTLRYFNVFGPHQDSGSEYSGVLAIFIRGMLQGEQLTIYGDGTQSRDFTYVENVVYANLLAASAPADKVSGQTINVATGTSVSLNDTYRILCDLTGYEGLPKYRPFRVGDIRTSLADIHQAEERLGYGVKVGFREGLRRTVEWYRRDLAAPPRDARDGKLRAEECSDAYAPLGAPLS
jgi:UDP-glucose 4-epimerase